MNKRRVLAGACDFSNFSIFQERNKDKQHDFDNYINLAHQITVLTPFRFAFALLAVIGFCPCTATAQVCDGRLCDTAASYEALKEYEETVDQWHAMSPPSRYPPHFGQLPLTARDQRKAWDYVDDLDPGPEGTIARETRLGLDKLNDDNLSGYPDYQSALFHAISSVYGHLYPGQMQEPRLKAGQSLWSDDDTLGVIKEAGLATPAVTSFLSGIKYGDYGVKMFCAKNFNLTGTSSTRPVEVQLILDYTFDTLTNEVRAGRVPTGDLNAAEAIMTSLESGVVSKPYSGWQSGFLAEINGAVLLRSLISSGSLAKSSTNLTTSTRGPVSGQYFIVSGRTQFAMPPQALSGFYAFVARVYSQAIVELSDGATLGAGNEIYKPWSPSQTAEVVALITSAVPELRPLGTSFVTSHAIGLAMAVENDPSKTNRKDFRRHVELAIVADTLISEAGDLVSERLKVEPVGPATSFDSVSTILRQKFLLSLTSEEETYKEALEKAVDPVNQLIKAR